MADIANGLQKHLSNETGSLGAPASLYSWQEAGNGVEALASLIRMAMALMYP